MSPEISLDLRREQHAQETGVVPILLVKLWHPDLDPPYYISSDPTQRVREDEERVYYGTISNGQEYAYYPMTAKLPDSKRDASPRATISVHAMPEIIEQLHLLPMLYMDWKQVTSLDLDRVERVWPSMKLTGVEYDQTRITGNLVVDMLSGEELPFWSYTPSTAPGVFR
ncbi:MAG: hypothetical protein AB7E51_06755 [Pseudodesulfovibrio sp.]|uniref:hypothetical protein n=1 Tax=Pseudodesulfovibrio sp. TaxID=2035812 RepID=UPI003D0F5141